MSTPDFIEVYDHALAPEACARIVERFEASGEVQAGRVGGGVFPELKDSDDIPISTRPGWEDVEGELNEALLGGLLRYLRKYPYTLLAPLMLQCPEPASGQLRRLVASDVEAMGDDELEALVDATLRPGTTNLQRYRADRGGYPYWHCELYPREPHAETLHRMLLWTLYLNDGFGDGETEFLHQGRKIVPRTGALLIAPVAFTHTHRGNTPRRADKYIATGWILFRRAEELFGAGLLG
jgi:hypothetical protein